MPAIADKLVIDFEPSERIAYLSAKTELKINSIDLLDELFDALEEAFTKLGPERMFMIVDLSKFIIDPSLARFHADKIRHIYENYLYPEGLARFGYQITRVTIKLGQHMGQTVEAKMFSTREEAYSYIRELIRRDHPDLVRDTEEEETITPDSEDTCIKIDDTLICRKL